MGSKILLTGGSGLLGGELRKLRDYLAPSRNELDVTNKKMVRDYIDRYRPEGIVHAAAYTNTQKADESQMEALTCYRTNVIGARIMATVASKLPLIYISTETALHPYNFYAVTKLQAENEIKRYAQNYVIVRTAFRPRPFPFDRACDDMYTIGDYVDIIAKKIDAFIGEGMDGTRQNDIIYIGTGIKTVYQLAKKTRSDVSKIKLTDLSFQLPPMRELFDIV